MRNFWQKFSAIAATVSLLAWPLASGAQTIGLPPGGQYGGQYGPPPGEQFGPPPGGQYGGQYGPPPGEQFGPPPGGQGPSEEEMTKRQEEMERRQQEQGSRMKKQALQQMKRGMKQFSTMLNRFKNKIDQLEKQGTPIPADCKESITKVVDLVNTILNAGDDFDMESFDFSELQSIGETIQECAPKIEQAAQLPRIIKQLNAQVTRLEKRVKGVETRAARAELDLSNILQTVRGNLDQLKADIESLKTSDDPFALMEELPERFHEIDQDLSSVEGLFQMQKVVKTLSSKAARYEQRVKRLESKKAENAADARAVLEELKGVIKELKALKVTEETFESIPELMERAFELVDQLEEELGLSKGPEPVFELKGKPVLPQFNAPQFDKLMKSVSKTRFASN